MASDSDEDGTKTPPPRHAMTLGSQVNMPLNAFTVGFVDEWTNTLFGDTADDELWVSEFGETREQWQNTNTELAQRFAMERDDEALFELIRRDPRHLAQDAVLARILDARSAVRDASRANDALYGDFATRLRKRKDQAIAFLNGLGRALSCSVGKGKGRAAPSKELCVATADVATDALYQLYCTEPAARESKHHRVACANDREYVGSLARKYRLPDAVVKLFLETEVVSASGRGFSPAVHLYVAKRYRVSEAVAKRAVGDRVTRWFREQVK